MLALVLALTLGVPACAAAEDTGFSDMDATVWYADAVVYCRERGWMAGTSATTFSPEGTLTRAQLVTILYRVEGEPAVTGNDSFTDTEPDRWYSNAVLWASQQGLVNGYGNGLFGTNDPVTQEHLTLIFQRYTEAAVTEGIPGFDGSRSPATRAQTAAVLMAYGQSQDQQTVPSGEGRTLVAYFSATNNTETIANHLRDILGADIYEITPETSYTSADLNYNDNSSRANREQNDPAARPAISGSVENMPQYDVIFLGYPIWHGQAPRIISTFLESYDLSGKTIVPFCTSGSSPIGSSAENLHALASGAVWLDDNRFSGSASRSTVENWVDGLELPKSEAPQSEGDASMLNLTINGTVLTAALADNTSAQALRELLADGPLTIDMNDYGNMEKVGPLGTSLPTNDEQITTQAGDIILYQGNNLVIYYAPNSYHFTRLGRINNVTAQGLRDILGDGSVSVTLSLG